MHRPSALDSVLLRSVIIDDALGGVLGRFVWRFALSAAGNNVSSLTRHWLDKANIVMEANMYIYQRVMFRLRSALALYTFMVNVVRTYMSSLARFSWIASKETNKQKQRWSRQAVDVCWHVKPRYYFSHFSVDTGEAPIILSEALCSLTSRMQSKGIVVSSVFLHYLVPTKLWWYASKQFLEQL